MLKLFLAILICVSNALLGIEAKELYTALHSATPPFTYPLKLTMLPAHDQNARVMICFHGSGSDFRIAQILRSNPAIHSHLVSFNFPDSGEAGNRVKGGKTTYGTIQELLPALFVLKQAAVIGHLKSVDLYGFSAGGGAVINTLAVLNTNKYDSDLEKVGITRQDKKTILAAIENGYVILDCPLKSMDEIAWQYGESPDLKILSENYKKNDFRPIDSLKKLEGLKLNVILYFSHPDDSLTNRDDVLYVQNLQEANKLGKTRVVFGDEGGHLGYHASLWRTYNQIVEYSVLRK